MRISYCVQWFRGYHRPSKMLTEAQARRVHERGKLYTVLLGDPLRPHCFLEFSAFRSVCVEFLDGALRTYFHYSFQEKRPNELFISASHRPEFPNEHDPPDRATDLHFKTDGHLTIIRYEANPTGVGSKIVGQEELIVDVSRNWEPFPEFGDYQGLATIDRGTELLRCPNSPVR